MKSKVDFINEKTTRALMKLFIPLMLAMTLTMAYSMVDSLWVGNLLGEAGMSALTASTAIVLVICTSPILSGCFGQGAEVGVIVAEFFHIVSIGYVLYMLTSCIQGYKARCCRVYDLAWAPGAVYAHAR